MYLSHSKRLFAGIYCKVMIFLVIPFILEVIKHLTKIFDLLIGKLVHYTVDFNEKYIPF